MDKQTLMRYGSNFLTHINTKSSQNMGTHDSTNSVPPTKPKRNFTKQFNLTKILKDEIFAKFIENVSNEELLAIISKYMIEKAYPLLNNLSCHYLVFQRVKNGVLRGADNCIENKRQKGYSTTTLDKEYDFCYICEQRAMIYGVFCSHYPKTELEGSRSKHHVHITLCISCGGKIEMRGSIIYDKLCKDKYTIFVRKFIVYMSHLPLDIRSIIMYYAYRLLLL